MFQDFLLKKMLKSQGLPEDQIETIVGAFKKNPELFKTIAAEIETKVKSGADKQTAALEVMQKYSNDLKSLF